MPCTLQRVHLTDPTRSLHHSYYKRTPRTQNTNPWLCQQIFQMASSKFKNLFQKRLNSKLLTTVSGLKKENAFLKKSLTEFLRKHSEHVRLVEVSLNTVTFAV